MAVPVLVLEMQPFEVRKDAEFSHALAQVKRTLLTMVLRGLAGQARLSLAAVDLLGRSL